MTYTDPAWEDFARREPFFTMVPIESYRRANLKPADEAAYFSGGDAHLDWMFRVMMPLTGMPRSALDYDCGIGRLTIALARRVNAVTAVTRSPALLEHARQQATRRGVTHVAFRTADDFERVPGQFDFVVCELTLQRLPHQAGADFLQRLLTRVAPGGVAVIQFPYQDTASAGVRLSRSVRRRVPLFNRLANRVRRKPVDDPFMPAFTYSIEAVMDVVRRSPMETAIVWPDHRADPPTATLFVRAPLSAGSADANATQPDAAAADGTDQAGFINVRDLIASTSIEELNRTAEAYFSTLTNWDHHLAKPFAAADQAAPLLGDAALILQGLRLRPGLRVLDFGAGSGWLSRWLTQLGCEAVLVDVSPTALKIAQALYERLPVIGTQPAPVFLPFDGRRIDLPDGSVDRIVSFHAFHHVPNPDDILREFARVLTPDGIAAFTEPGPRHSRSPLSQFEMRTYHVVENDVDVRAIWATARDAGFTEMRLAVYHQPPFHVSLEEFDAFVGGAGGDRWIASTRQFLQEARTFFLIKGIQGIGDSRMKSGLACQLQVTLRGAGRVTAGQPIAIAATVTNSGVSPWRPWGSEGGVALGVHVYDDRGTLINFDFYCVPLTDPPREIPAGTTINVDAELPGLPAGRYRLEFDCVAAEVTWFAQVGSTPVTLPLDVVAGDS